MSQRKSTFEFGTTDYPPEAKVEQGYEYARGRFTGTLVAGGGDPPPATSGDYRVRWIDYDGTVLRDEWVDHGEDATAPTLPTHAELTFQEWNQPHTNIQRDRDIGATYITTDGKTHVHVRLTKVSGLDLTLYMNKSDASTMSIDWGDGTTDDFTDSGNFNTGAHTFPDEGDYVIKIWISSGSGTYGLGNGTHVTQFCGGPTAVERSMLLRLYIGSDVPIVGNNAMLRCPSMTEATIPAGVTSVGVNAFQESSAIAGLVFPLSVTTISNAVFTSVANLRAVSIPDGATSLGAAFRTTSSLSMVVIPHGVTALENNSFDGSGISSIRIPSSILSTGSSCFINCRRLSYVVVEDGLTSIGASTFNGCWSIAALEFPASLSSVAANAFFNCYSIVAYAFLSETPPTLAGANAFTNINTICRIFVPDASVLAYQGATNWSTYADYIYPLSVKSGNAVIVFEDDDATAPVAPLVGTAGNTATAPVAPTKAGKVFAGWYKEAGLTTAWNWPTDVYPSTFLILYAKWEDE